MKYFNLRAKTYTKCCYTIQYWIMGQIYDWMHLRLYKILNETLTSENFPSENTLKYWNSEHDIGYNWGNKFMSYPFYKIVLAWYEIQIFLLSHLDTNFQTALKYTHILFPLMYFIDNRFVDNLANFNIYIIM